MTATPLRSPLRAVVVDDTPDLRTLLVLALESSGEIVVVAEAGNGLEGVVQVRAHQPDLVLLDLAMPVMDGLEALPAMREDCPDATIIVLSGFGASAMASRAVAAGANGYLQKGAPAAVILDYVRGLVGRPPGGLRLLAKPAKRATPADDWTGTATELAPYGVVVARDAPSFPVLSANPRAIMLLGGTPVGRPLSVTAPTLADLAKRIEVDVHHQTTVGHPPREVNVLVRRDDDVVLLYLDQTAPDDADLLRRAIATTAHEIRNPVTVLVGIADTLRDRGDELTDELRHRLRASVVRQARLLDSMTADLLTAAQAHRGTLRVDLDVVEVKGVLAAVLDEQIDEVAVDVAEPLRVLADPLRLEQMVTNLLTNARKYGAPPISVAARRLGQEVVIEVLDRGPGVAEEFEPTMFDEYTRAGENTARGTGLGLFVVRSLAEAQGGSVAYERRPEGGAIFRVCLRVAPE